MLKYSSRRRALLASASAAVAIGALMSGSAAHAADSASGPQAGTTIGELVVTAGRRSESVAKAPYNISAYGGQDLVSRNIISMSGLSHAVPNFVVEDSGAGQSSQTIPIIRGMNASRPDIRTPRYAESPVGFYLGNAPLIDGVPFMDIDRIEVLRGPQGTLYGDGTLAGAVRVVPNEPKLGKFSALASAGVSGTQHSSAVSYEGLGMVNLPLGDKAALRLVVQEQREGGYIDQFDIMARQGNDYQKGFVLSANPADSNSPAVYFNKNDVNWTKTLGFRSTLLWEPTDKFKLLAAYNYAYINGNGSPTDSSGFVGGSSPLDPRVDLTPTGHYQISNPILEPFERRSHLASLDLSYDLGFATLAGTSSYGYTSAETITDQTYNLLNGLFGAYYFGSPKFPRAAISNQDGGSEKNYAEEVRLVSNGTHRIDYVAGLYYTHQSKFIQYTVYDPGVTAWTAANNDGTLGAIATEPDERFWHQEGVQTFQEYSAYGNMTLHVTDKWQITGGARVFHENFSQTFEQLSKEFGFDVHYLDSSSVTSEIFMANTAYAVTPLLKVYGTFSQGFRRGGANALPLAGPYLVPASMIPYSPDKTNNFEVGVKGTLGGIYFALSGFYIKWDNPQIDLMAFLGYNAVVNGSAAESKGFEFEAQGPIPVGIQGLSFNGGLAFSRARLTQSFAVPDSYGTTINGVAGDRLPGTPDWSGSLNLTYDMKLADEANLRFSLGGDFRSSSVNLLYSPIATNYSTPNPGYVLFNGSVEWRKGDKRIELYVNNLLDKYVVYAEKVARTDTTIDPATNFYGDRTVARPREIGIRITKEF